MKHLISLSLIILGTLPLLSQTPEKMSYQAIIRTNENTLVSNTNINLKILIKQGTPTGITIYEENHSATTNINGLVSIEIGTGTIINGNFSSISWFDSSYFVETQFAINGDNNFNLIGISQLLSVPYSLHAKTAEYVLNTPDVSPFRAEVITVTNNRMLNVADIYNTIACTSTATVSIPLNFNAMEIGDTINLEAHNGTILTIAATAGVSLNYINSGTAQFISKSGNVRFGLLRKSGTNEYIISGQ